jgi:hypothetical protein
VAGENLAASCILQKTPNSYFFTTSSSPIICRAAAAAAQNAMGAFLPLLLLAVAANAGLLVIPSHGLSQDGLFLLDAKRALTVPDGALAD